MAPNLNILATVNTPDNGNKLRTGERTILYYPPSSPSPCPHFRSLCLPQPHSGLPFPFAISSLLRKLRYDKSCETKFSRRTLVDEALSHGTMGHVIRVVESLLPINIVNQSILSKISKKKKKRKTGAVLFKSLNIVGKKGTVVPYQTSVSVSLDDLPWERLIVRQGKITGPRISVFFVIMSPYRSTKESKREIDHSLQRVLDIKRNRFN